jgi:sulfatase modifying factor 1
MKLISFLVIVLLVFNLYVQAQSTPEAMKMVEGGTYVPMYGLDTLPVKVQDFYMDKYPVTNTEYLDFVKNNPRWKKSQVKRLFADGNYLRNWTSDSTLGKNSDLILRSPVTYVSWFAAKAYCECMGKRLPTVDEWEFAARASETKVNGFEDPEFYQKILDWYSKPNPAVLPSVESSLKNYYGIYGMIGLVWEWNSDFNSTLLVGESRANQGIDRELFCGAGSLGSSDSKNYAAYMRYAFRSSLKANYTVSNLGFRCVKSVNVN